MGMRDDFINTVWIAEKQNKSISLSSPEKPPKAFLEDYDLLDSGLAYCMRHHDNRYAWMGGQLLHSPVKFGWDAVAMAEIRDLNRHRTGAKHCPLVPVGFYLPVEQIPASVLHGGFTLIKQLCEMREFGAVMTNAAMFILKSGDPSYLYWLPLGTQFSFEHVTTADKFIYEAELRTGTGAHFRYAQHLRDVLEIWYGLHPETKGLILEGSAEPE